MKTESQMWRKRKLMEEKDLAEDNLFNFTNAHYVASSFFY